MAKISFIIPVYNSELYLRRCLDSVFSQTEADFQAILIDDGSTDKSGDICKEYASHDSRFSYHYQENKWVAAARNIGLKYAKNCEYISFIDSDDYIQPDYIERLYLSAKDSGADILSFGYQRNTEGKVECEVPKDKIVEPTCNTVLEHFCSDWLHTPRQNYVWSKLFKQEFLNETGCTFTASLRAAEDRNFLYKILYKSKRTVYVSASPYFYFQHNESMTRSSVSSSVTFFKGYLDSYSDIIRYWHSKEFYTFDSIKPIILYHALQSALFNSARALGDKKLALDVADLAFMGFPIDEEFEANKLSHAISVYADFCKLSKTEQIEIKQFASSLIKRSEGIL